jgi:PKD repeat protein
VAHAGSDVSACLTDAVTFDGSASSSSTGKPLTYRWDFGDGTSADGVQVTHVYQKGGTYRAVLTVSDGSGGKHSTSTGVRNVIVGAAPMAMLEKVGRVCAGDVVSFDASGSKDPDGKSLKYTWDFGDGKTQIGDSRVSHVYEKSGHYTANVEVVKAAGTRCKPVSTACNRSMASTDVAVSSDPDGDALTYRWNFGDGTMAEGAKGTHGFTKKGTYKVTLTVDDGSGTDCRMSQASFTVHVYGKPVPVINVK